MEIILLPISMAACLLAGVLGKVFITAFGSNQRLYHLFNIIISAGSALALFVISGGFKVSPFTVYLGLLFGIITAVNKICSLQAMDCGPYSYTAVITSLSTIIPTLSGKFIWGEEIVAVQYVGIALMLVCIILSVNFKEKQKSVPFKWYIFCFLTFVTTGSIGVMQRWHQSTEYKNELDEFLVIAFICSTITSVIGYFISKNKAEKEYKINSKGIAMIIVFGIISAFCVAANNKLNLYLSGVMDTAVFFPVVNGGGLVLTSVAAFVIFREKLSLQKWIGLIIGILSVILICNPFGS